MSNFNLKTFTKGFLQGVLFMAGNFLLSLLLELICILVFLTSAPTWLAVASGFLFGWYATRMYHFLDEIFDVFRWFGEFNKGNQNDRVECSCSGHK